MISTWLRVIRVRFLLASVVAVSAGLAITWWQTGNITLFDAVLTMAGVLCLHASVDLLNDYWDFKRGIDTTTQRTKMSGGSGVLPDGLLKPAQVYVAGIIFLIIGASIGIYFVATDGVIIGIILAFAVISIYFYSTKLVNWGLAEVFVTIKGTMIVIGTYFVQTQQITEGASPILQGATNGTIGPQGGDATAIMGVNTAGTVRVNNLANLEALLNIIANGMEILGIAWGGPTMIMGFMHMAAGTQDAMKRVLFGGAGVTGGLATPGAINWLVASARDANLFS